MITTIFIAICLIIFIYIQFISHDDKVDTALKLGAFYPPLIKENKEYWRFITCSFIHIDFVHFIMNAYAIYQLGSFFELVLGSIPYLYVIIVSMLLGSLMSYSASELFEGSYHTITIGASGVAYGFFGAICALSLLIPSYSYLLASFLPAIAINVIYTLFNPQISKTGHLGGFIGGFLALVVLIFLNMI